MNVPTKRNFKETTCTCFSRKSSGGNSFFVQRSSLTGLPGTGSDQQGSIGLESACTVSMRSITISFIVMQALLYFS